MPSSSIIIPVYNRAPLTRQCLQALLAGQYAFGRPEIIVVDDASTDLTPELLAGYGRDIQVVRQSTNSGFASACNNGAAAATGDYLVFLNNDTLPQPGWLDALLAYAEAHPAAAAVGAKLLFPNDTIQHAGVVICQDRLPRHIYSGFPAGHPAVNKSRRFSIVTGACLLVRRTVFVEANGFDTAFFNGYEDVDLCLRLGELGHEVHYCHTSVLYHFESATRPRSGDYLRASADMYQRRWRGRVVPDEVSYYAEDGLLNMVHGETYPLGVELSPLLGVMAAPGAELTVERLLNWRTQQVWQLLQETTARTTPMPMPELVEAVTVPAPASAAAKPSSVSADEPDLDLMHPDVEKLVGAGDPWAIGRLYLRYFIELGGLQPSHRVLEVGCGVGRMALPLARYLKAGGAYDGFDIVPASIDWCQRRITPRYPHFRFQHADVRNPSYNPAGRLEAKEFSFPYPDAAFDFVFLASVFTHMLPAEVEHYVAELARVLKPGGRGLLSVFLTDPLHLHNLATGQPLLTFPYDHGHYRTMLDARPEEAVAYDPAYLTGLLARHGLAVHGPIHFGNWSGPRDNEIIGQDIVVVVRQPAVAPAAPPVPGPAGHGLAAERPRPAGLRLLTSGRTHALAGGPAYGLISVLMPVKNGAPWLATSLAQILRQHITAQMEIIAVDSGSSDETVEILNEYGATVYGLDAAEFNHGTTRHLLGNLSNGEHLVFLNQTAVPADALWLAGLLAPLQTNALLAGVCSRVIAKASADPLEYREVAEGLSGSPERVVRALSGWAEYDALTPHERRLRLNFHTVSAAIRRDVLARFPFRAVPAIGEDLLWAKEVLLAGYQLQHEPASRVFHTHHYSLAQWLQRNVDDGIANFDIVGRQVDDASVMRAVMAQVADDTRYLVDDCGISGDELRALQQVAFMRRLAQMGGQWAGGHAAALDPALLSALSGTAQAKLDAAPPGIVPKTAQHRRPLPPPELRFRVTASREAEWFQRSGDNAIEDFAAALASQGQALVDFRAILDFGCGCGRLLRPLAAHLPADRLSGCDIDQVALQWVRTHLPLVDVRVNSPLPPTSFANGAFDLVLGYSVFTHLDEQYQDAWLAELQRVTAPGGRLLLTVHGHANWQALAASVPALRDQAPALEAQWRRDGFLHWRGDGWEQHFPDFYHTSWHTPDYIRRHWSRWFSVDDVLENQARPTHDLVVLRRA